jgi:hypothetical protein
MGVGGRSGYGGAALASFLRCKHALKTERNSRGRKGEEEREARE